MTLAAYAIARAAAQLASAQRTLTRHEVGLLETVLLPAINRYESSEMRPAKARAAGGSTGGSSATLPMQPAQRRRVPDPLY